MEKFWESRLPAKIVPYRNSLIPKREGTIIAPTKDESKDRQRDGLAEYENSEIALRPAAVCIEGIEVVNCCARAVDVYKKMQASSQPHVFIWVCEFFIVIFPMW